MATYAKLLLSESSAGAPVSVAATASPGTLVHTASATSGVLDEVWIWAHNVGTANCDVTIGFGGTAAKDLIKLSIPVSSGPIAVVPGLIVTGGVAVKAWATLAAGISLSGYINRITP